MAFWGLDSFLISVNVRVMGTPIPGPGDPAMNRLAAELVRYFLRKSEGQLVTRDDLVRFFDDHQQFSLMGDTLAGHDEDWVAIVMPLIAICVTFAEAMRPGDAERFLERMSQVMSADEALRQEVPQQLKRINLVPGPGNVPGPKYRGPGTSGT